MFLEGSEVAACWYMKRIFRGQCGKCATLKECHVSRISIVLIWHELGVYCNKTVLKLYLALRPSAWRQHQIPEIGSFADECFTIMVTVFWKAELQLGGIEAVVHSIDAFATSWSVMVSLFYPTIRCFDPFVLFREASSRLRINFLLLPINGQIPNNSARFSFLTFAENVAKEFNATRKAIALPGFVRALIRWTDGVVC